MTYPDRNDQRHRRIHVLVVDDSAVVREALRSILTRESDFQVSTAPDPVLALELIRRNPPDVIILDIELPNMDGLAFMRRLRPEYPIPILVCSGLAGPTASVAVRMLSEGAVGLITKPSLQVREFLLDSATTLVEQVRAAARARVSRAEAAPESQLPVPPSSLSARRANTPPTVIAIGASMGGPEALEYILSRLPANIPPMVIVQHMPQGFTQAFARRLEARCRFRVVEARDGDALEVGRALLAPGNRHLVVRQVTTGLRAFLEDAPPEAFHRPSVNVLFRSVAAAVRANAVGVILTGMGDDGAAGLRAMRDAGARTLAQDEASSVVFGMPRVAASMGAVQQLVPLALMPSEIMKACERQVRTERGRESAS